MRWFIEVSTVGGGETDIQYCVEAKQWQAALQQARKLRGEGGPLSAFSIELLDNGYRAVDKKQNLKYVVKKAPNDAPLSDGKNGVTSAAAEGHSASSRAPEASAPEPPAAEPVSSPPVSRASQQQAVPKASGPPPRPRLESSRPPASADDKQLGKSGSSDPAAKQGGTGTKKPPQKVAELLAAAALKAGGSSTPRGADAPSPTPGVGAEPSSAHPPEPAALKEAPGASLTPEARPDADGHQALPEFEVIRERNEEPSAETPIAYREVALGVKPGTSKQAVRNLLLARYESIAKELRERPKGKFVQLAVFDHAFAKKPIRPPLATLMWKDWRGEPVLSFAGFTTESQPPPPPAAGEDIETGSLRPISVIPVDETTGSVPPPPKESSEPMNADVVSSGSLKAPSPPSDLAEPADAALSDNGPAAAGLEARGSDIAKPASSDADSGGRKPNKDQGKGRISRPGKERLQSSDDLIGHLFENMHDLHFMADVVAGAEFVLSVVKDTLPSAYVLVHVFDINSKNFVVVRQHGGSQKVLMYQTPDRDAQLRRVMRAPRSVSLSGVSREFTEGRWKAAEVVPDCILCGPVKQGGRYLGLIELGKPVGAKAFNDSEANALDYICEQFAEFLANRPIVLDSEVILK